MKAAAGSAQSAAQVQPRGAEGDTLQGVLLGHALTRPNTVFLRILAEEAPQDLTFAQAWSLAQRWALHFRQHGARPGDVVHIGFPNGSDFVGAFFGALLADCVPAPMMPRRNAASEFFNAYVADRLALSGRGMAALPEADAGDAEALAFKPVTPRGLPQRLGGGLEAADFGDPGRTALLQYTSGTSGRSKAVALSHAALLFQAAAITEVLGLDAEIDHAVSWLPFYHDMGLIGFLLTPLLLGGRVALLTTEQVMIRPSVWMDAVSRQRATITGGPPSAYVMAARFARSRRTTSLDLSCLRVALIGAERITRPALEMIESGFETSGLSAAALTPAYGMAEVGLAVTISPPGDGASFMTISREHMRQNARAVTDVRAPLDCGEPVVTCGRPVPGVEVKILSGGRAASENEIGDIVVRSPSVMSGYRGLDSRLPNPVKDGWYSTGDRGFLSNGALYFTARAGEILVVGGANYLPEEYEEVARAAIERPVHRAVAFACDNVQSGSESVVVLVENERTTPEDRSALAARIRTDLTERRLPVGRVVVVPPRTIKLTGNGKLPRARLKARYLEGEFGHA